MTQKKAVGTFLESLENPTIKKFFLAEWLEDINWHTECSILLMSLNKYEEELIEILQEVDYLINPGAYSRAFLKEFEPTVHIKSIAEEIIAGRSDAVVTTKSGEILCSADIFHDFHHAKAFQQALSYLYGWGICHKEWTSGGTGVSFVGELLELAGLPVPASILTKK